MTPVVAIPARLRANRLPGKPLADIQGTAMIVHVWRRAVAADIGPVVVACGDAEIAAAIEAVGGRAVMTDPDLPSGSDRVHAAIEDIDPAGRFDVVVNIQGDLPTLDAAVARAVLRPLAVPEADIATLAAPLAAGEIDNPNVVKAVLAPGPAGAVRRALAFMRRPPADAGALFHHIGIYAYRRRALARFVALPPSANEQREKLEQLRALDDGMRIDVALVDTVPFGVDTPADLDRARALLAPGTTT